MAADNPAERPALLVEGRPPAEWVSPAADRKCLPPCPAGRMGDSVQPETVKLAVVPAEELVEILVVGRVAEPAAGLAVELAVPAERVGPPRPLASHEE